ncbi:unnamed protein product [Paramecium sonneborni]|uniref:Uncharacterized protein n=1 Tax=Paramecium sonneborni TaxID=65129 RepID=A0A8S1NXS1_9CILI|nr:unnamed protein product [Paramecium sonneborni]
MMLENSFKIIPYALFFYMCVQTNKLNFQLDSQPEESMDSKVKKGKPAIDLTQVLVYELKSRKTIHFQLYQVYQDSVQLSQQQKIDKIVKNWQKEEAKNKKFISYSQF